MNHEITAIPQELNQTNDVPKNGFCIMIDTLCGGTVPSVSDAEDKFVVFDTEREAQKEIVDNMMTRLQQFLDGERDFEDAITTEEFISPVTVYSDGLVIDETGCQFALGYDANDTTEEHELSETTAEP